MFGLASCKQGKLIKSANGTQSDSVVCQCGHTVMQCSGAGSYLGKERFMGTKRPDFLWLAPKRRSQKSFLSKGGAREYTGSPPLYVAAFFLNGREVLQHRTTLSPLQVRHTLSFFFLTCSPSVDNYITAQACKP